MKKIEFALWTIVITAKALWLVPMPGASFLFFIGMLSLCIFYFACSLFLYCNISFNNIFGREVYREIPATHIFLASICGPIAAIGCMGLLFKLQLWPGGLIFLIFSVILSIPILIITLTKIPGKHKLFYRRILARLGTLTVVFAIIFFGLHTIWLEKIRYRNHADIVSMLNIYQEDTHNYELRQQINKMEIHVDYNR